MRYRWLVEGSVEVHLRNLYLLLVVGGRIRVSAGD